MFEAKAQVTTVRTTKQTAIWAAKLSSIFIISFVVALLIKWEGVGEAPNAFFPENFCVAFADPAMCPKDAGPTCSPCNGQACGCPCFGGVCGEAIMGPCPAQWTAAGTPPSGYGVPDSNGVIFCADKVCSPAGCDKMCPTGMDPTAPYPPVLTKMTPEEHCQSICPANLCGKGALSQSQKDLLVFLDIIEIMYFAGGATFAIVVGPKVFSMAASKLKTACILIYLTLCYHLLTWLPHIAMHLWFPDNDAVLALEFAFHVPIAASSIILVVYVYRMLKMSSSYRAPQPQGSSAFMRFVHGPYALPTLVSVVFTIPALVVDYAVPNAGSATWTSAQEVGFRIVSIFQAVEFGISMGFLVLMAPVIRGVEELRVFKQVIPLTFSLWFLMSNWFWHSFTHTQITFPFKPSHFLAMEFSFHWISQICSVVVAWNMMKLVDMALAYDTSPFRKTTTGGASQTSKASKIGTNAQLAGSSVTGKAAWQPEHSSLPVSQTVSPMASPVTSPTAPISKIREAPAHAREEDLIKPFAAPPSVGAPPVDDQEPSQHSGTGTAEDTTEPPGTMTTDGTQATQAAGLASVSVV